MKNLEELAKRIETIENKASSMQSNIPSEQLVYNGVLSTLLDELNAYEMQIKNALNEKIKTVLTKENVSLDEIDNEINDLKQIIQFKGEESAYLKESGLDKILYKISYSKDVDIINKNIRKYLDCMKQYDVNLEVTQFNYSYYTLKYMSMFYDNEDENNFYIVMKKYFEEIYWSCPNIIKQLVLNFISLAEENKKNIHKSILNKRNKLVAKMHLENESIDDRYFLKLNEFYNNSNTDTFYIYEYLSEYNDFLNKIINLKYDDLIKKYSTKQLSGPNDEQLFIENIDSFQSNLTEYINLVKYKYVLEYEKEILSNKDKKEKVNKKELIKLTNKKDSYNKKIIKLNKTKEKYKIFGKLDGNIDKKIRINNAYLTSLVDEIYKLTIKNYIEEFNEDIINNLSENSNIYDSIGLANKHYMALSNIIYEKKSDVDICSEIDGMENILFTRDSFISRNTSLDFFDNISSLINKKYILCNINTDIDFEDYTSIRNVIDELFFLVLSYNLKKKGLSLTDIEICIKRMQD